MTFKIWKLKFWVRIVSSTKPRDSNFVFFGEWNDECMSTILGTRYDFFFELYRFKSGFSILN